MAIGMEELSNSGKGPFYVGARNRLAPATSIGFLDSVVLKQLQRAGESA